MNPSIRLAAVCLVAAPMLTGCGGLMKQLANLSPKRADLNTVEEAKNKGDTAALEKYCDRSYKKPDGKALNGQARSRACKYKNELLKKEAVDALTKSTCKDAKATWLKYKSAVGNRGTLKKVFPMTAVKLAKCGDYDYVFKEMIHWGPHIVGAIGRKAIEAMDKAGLPVEKEYLKWMGQQKSQPWDNKLGPYALDHYLNWRLAKGGNIDCKPYVKAWSVVDGASEMAWTYVFYRKTKCTAAADYVAKGLVSPRPKTRHRACMTLGIVGNKSHVKKMEILAKSDGSFKIVRYNKVYWVRDQCRQAVGQIKMR